MSSPFTESDREAGHSDPEMLKGLEELLLSELDYSEKKRGGVFFTPEKIAKKLISDVEDLSELRFLDPACGTGNLLIEIARQLPLSKGLAETLRVWNRHLFGVDINEDFVLLAKRKIVALARERGAIGSNRLSEGDYVSLLSNIVCADFLAVKDEYKGLIDAVITNPPYSMMPTPNGIDWSSGKVNASAVFVDYCIDLLPPNGRLFAILPDVLRSGSRYGRWRSKLSTSIQLDTKVHGAFGASADVDVFLLRGTQVAIEAQIGRGVYADEVAPTVSRYFSVHSGVVVPHRDEFDADEESPYAHAKTLPKWTEVIELPERIRHGGRKFSGPMVVVRRTSSPSDRDRAVATLINCQEPVSIENHLLVLIPVSGNIEDCRRLMVHLRSPDVTRYLNDKIRCRHLTVTAVKSIPFELGGDRE